MKARINLLNSINRIQTTKMQLKHINKSKLATERKTYHQSKREKQDNSTWIRYKTKLKCKTELLKLAIKKQRVWVWN